MLWRPLNIGKVPFPVSLLQLSVRFPPKSFSWYMMSNTHAHTHTHTPFDQPLDNMTAPMLFVSPILFHIFAPECCYHLKILPYMLSLFGLNEVEFMLFTNFRLWFTNQAFPNFCQSPPTPAKIPFGLTYCWWKKSGEPVEVGSWNPIIYREFYIPGVSLGISEPSTVCKEALSTTHDRCHLPNVRQSFVLRSRNSTRDVVEFICWTWCSFRLVGLKGWQMDVVKGQELVAARVKDFWDQILKDVGNVYDTEQYVRQHSACGLPKKNIS